MEEVPEGLNRLNMSCSALDGVLCNSRCSTSVAYIPSIAERKLSKACIKPSEQPC